MTDNATDQVPGKSPETLDPNDSELLRDELKGQTLKHAKPPRLEDEGQSGG
jgi:hypothetical protein